MDVLCTQSLSDLKIVIKKPGHYSSDIHMAQAHILKIWVFEVVSFDLLRSLTKEVFSKVSFAP